jgi:hypothetical protein
MKLFTVTVEYEYVVAAEDFDDARDVARDYALEAMKDWSTHELDYTIFQGVTANGWTDDCLPYGGDGNKTIGEYKNG